MFIYFWNYTLELLKSNWNYIKMHKLKRLQWFTDWLVATVLTKKSRLFLSTSITKFMNSRYKIHSLVTYIRWDTSTVLRLRKSFWKLKSRQASYIIYIVCKSPVDLIEWNFLLSFCSLGLFLDSVFHFEFQWELFSF